MLQYREYKQEPLTITEWQNVLEKLKQPANTLLRKRDKMYKELGLTGNEDDKELLPHFTAHPTLVQRPIFIFQGQAVVGRPVEKILTIIK